MVSLPTYIAAALGAGATGFLLKSGDPRELLAGVHAIADGASYLSPAVAHRVIAQLGPDRLARAVAARRDVARLTGREHEVLALLARGLSNAQIARRLHVVEGTVKAHVSTILIRLGAANRVQPPSSPTKPACSTSNDEQLFTKQNQNP